MLFYVVPVTMELDTRSHSKFPTLGMAVLEALNEKLILRGLDHRVFSVEDEWDTKKPVPIVAANT